MASINPRVDIAFKKIFGVEENKDLLVSLINSIVGQEDQVSDITLLNPYNPKHFKSDKLSILDIKATNQDGKRFNIEIQITDNADYDKRALYYWAKIYTEQLRVAEDYSKLEKAIGIHILNFTSIPEATKYHNVFHIAEKDTGILYFKDLELHTIELKKFSDNSDESLTEILPKVKNALDMWSAFLTRNDLLNPDNLPQELNDLNLKKAINVLNVMNFSDEERDAYEDRLKWLRDEASAILHSEKKGIAKGIEIGMEKGLAEGMEKGREEGLEKGREEGLAEGMEKGVAEGMKLTAINMLKQKLSDSLIMQVTGLSQEELDGLKSKI
ncbi:MAG: Rpn family recombination-promoting nuclease/putative transposase [Alphaproteobacteria bacterium]|nr:Rpn family recombination-promoting nuclease/putative transposase [Alphaproteobacteria bacterium]